MGATVAYWSLLADTVSRVESFVSVFVTVYVLVIFAYIITSWIRLPYSPWLSRVQRFLFDVCEPYLRLWRRFLPSLGGLDFSPIIAFFALGVLDRVLLNILDRFH